MPLFYTPHIEQPVTELPRSESHHAVKVLRLQSSAPVHLTDGRGQLATGTIDQANAKRCTVHVEKIKQQYQKRDYRLHIAIAPPKQRDRLSFFLEKATEIGVDAISFLYCARSERDRVRMDRAEKVVIGAMKQAFNVFKPELYDMRSLKSFLKSGQLAEDQQRMACLTEIKPSDYLPDTLINQQKVLILIGPEGGFDENEIALVSKHDFQPVTLGAHRLRTETAGIVACQIVNQTFAMKKSKS